MKIGITETVLRDANQSLIATRMPFEAFEPILEKMDSAGYYSLECWGGATFDSCLRFLNEDPWDRLRKIRAKVKNTKLQMLLRGQNLLGYKHYPDDVVRKFVSHSVEAGIDIIRIFDALNDLRNIKVAVEETLKCGAHASGAISYTVSPVHTLGAYVKLGKELEQMGVYSICIKDMAGILSPDDAATLVKALKDSVSVPIVVHTHATTGLASMTYMRAAEAGADVIDTAISCFSGGTSQPATETMNFVLRQHGLDTGLDAEVLREINSFFKPLQKEYLENGLLDPFVMTTDPDALTYQVPGGMLSNLVSQLKVQNALDRLPEVLAEVPKVREDLGFPPLVTPMSQLVGVQAVQNVLAGERYKSVIKELSAYLRGEYGKTPAPVNPDLVTKVLGENAEIIECRFADTLEPMFEKTKSELGELAKSDEDVLSYVAFPSVAQKYFEIRENGEPGVFKYSVSEKQNDAAVYSDEKADDLTRAVLTAIAAKHLNTEPEKISLNSIKVLA